MKTSTRPWQVTLSLLVLAETLLAQSVPSTPEQRTASAPRTEDEPVQLSPFHVSGHSDVGYQATSTLAGTRLRTELRDIGSSISIVNEEFLTDTGSTNLEDVLVFTPNTEIGGLGGNFSGSQGAAPIPEQQRDNPSGGITRVRGLASADLTRDYFLSDVPFDTFNTDRIDVQRGANSALFGLGSPGGIVNATTIRADFLGNRGRVRFETDQYGTTRYSMRYNQMIGDVAAVRVAGLSERKQYEQKQAFLEDDRLFVTATVKLPWGLTARGSVETAKRHSANPDFVPPNDGITPWINMGKPVIMSPAQGGALFRGTGTFFPGRANSQVMTLALPGLSSGFATFYHDPSNPNPTFGGQAYIPSGQKLPSAGGLGEWMMLMPQPEEQIIRLTGGYRSDGTRVPEGSAPFYSNGFVAQQITDRSIFDYRKNLFNGGTAQQGADWEVYHASIEGNYFENRFGFEVSYYKQEFDSWGNNSLQGVLQRTIYIDPNAYLIATADGTGTGALIPNPNFGRPVMGGNTGGNNLTNDRDAFRIQAYTEVRFDDFLPEDRWFTKLLGRFTLTGLLDESSTYNKQAYSRGDPLDYEILARHIGGGSLTGFPPLTQRSGQQFALPVAANDTNFLTINSLSDLAGVGIRGVSHGRARSYGRGLITNNYTGWNQHTQQFVGFTSPVYTMWNSPNDFPAAFSASKRLTEVESQVLVGQSYLWDGTIVLTGTWRSDTSSTASVGAPTLTGRTDVDNTYDPAYLRGVRSSDLQETYDDETTSWSAVVHTPEFIQKRLPGNIGLSFHYAKSDNFVPSGSNVDIYNRLVPAVSGKTEEKGFTIAAFDGKLSARFNWFETDSANNRFENAAISTPATILQNLAHQLDHPLNVAQGFTAADAQAVLPPQGVIDVSGFVVDWSNPNAASTSRNPADTDTRDFSATGMEVEIAYNPTEKWTILFTAARQETVTSNTYPVMKQFVESFVIPTWVNSDFAKKFVINDTGTQTLAELAQTAIVENVQRAALEDGKPTIEQAEWRWSVNTSYKLGKFDEGILRWFGNLTVGGGLRWEDKVGIGFGVGKNALGDYAFDLNQPYWSDTTMFVDAFVRSTWRLRDRRSFTFQINVKDLTNNDDLKAYVANPDGSKLYRILEGRLFTASATLEF
jgi:outer membrane receptor protein involved in Fe transport